MNRPTIQRNVITRLVGTLAIAASLSFVAGTASFAATSTVTATHSTTTTTTPSQALRAYRAALKNYNFERRLISVAYKNAIATAKATCNRALRRAKTNAARSAARAALKLAVINASAARETALVVLGNPPVKH